MLEKALKTTNQLTLIFALLGTLSFCTKVSKTGVTAEPGNNQDTIRVGVIAGPEADLMEAVKAEAKSKLGLTIKLITFNDFTTPNIALENGDIDANAFQHAPFLEAMKLSHGLKVDSVAKTFIYPLAGYSTKVKNIEQLSMAAKIAIPSDPSNESRALLLLASKGLITLKSTATEPYSTLDIASNPKGIKFLSMEAAGLPRVLPDVDLAIINSVFASVANLNPAKDGVIIEGKDSPYANLIAVRENDKEKQWVKKLVTAFHSDKVKQAAQEIFAGNAIPAWN